MILCRLPVQCEAFKEALDFKSIGFFFSNGQPPNMFECLLFYPCGWLSEGFREIWHTHRVDLRLFTVLSGGVAVVIWVTRDSEKVETLLGGYLTHAFKS